MIYYTIYCMDKLTFKWDKRKSTTNVKKHKVDFDEAKIVFYDENAIQFFEPDHSGEEERFILLGTSFKLNTIIVCHCFRQEDTVVRIISARTADNEEEAVYWSNRK